MTEIKSSEYQCTECCEEQHFFGRRAEEKQCMGCGSYSFIQLSRDEETIKLINSDAEIK